MKKTTLLILAIILFSGCLATDTKEQGEINSIEEALSAEQEVSKNLLSSSQNLTSVASSI